MYKVYNKYIQHNTILLKEDIMETWRDIEELNGKYEISSYGRLRNKTNKVVLKPRKNYKGYLDIKICGKTKLLHRLVAQTFISNPDNKPQVNHIDEDKTNNHVDNLEWVTAKENSNWGTRNDRRVMNTDYRKRNSSYGYVHRLDNVDWDNVNKDKKIAVVGKNVNGNESLFKSIREASRATGASSGHISECINGKRKSAGGYIWVRITS